jgi:hypothetical protein
MAWQECIGSAKKKQKKISNLYAASVQLPVRENFLNVIMMCASGCRTGNADTTAPTASVTQVFKVCERMSCVII